MKLAIYGSPSFEVEGKVTVTYATGKVVTYDSKTTKRLILNEREFTSIEITG